MLDLKTIEKELQRVTQKYHVSKASAQEHKVHLKSAEALSTSALEAQKILQEIAADIQQQAHQHIAFIVSRCLSAVFDEPYEFKIDFEQKRGKTDARLYFVRNGIEIDPMTAAGGGVVDVCSFALRLACLSLARPAKRKLLVLDEPFRFVSSEYRDRIRELLEQLSEEMDIQIIVITHISELETGKVIQL